MREPFFSFVTPGLDPGVQGLDCRVEPGDDKWVESRLA